MVLRYLSALPLALALTLGMVWLMQALIEHRSIADELERPPLRLLYLANDNQEMDVDAEQTPADEEAPEPEPVPEPVAQPEPVPEPVPEPEPIPEPEPAPIPEPLPLPEPKVVELPPPPVEEPLPPKPEPAPQRPRPEPKPAKPQAKPQPQKAAKAKPPGNAEAAKVPAGLNGPPIYRPKPRYPEAARRAGTQGWVMVGFSVSRSGTTTGISVLSASPPGVFDQAAREAVAKWRYQAQPIDRPGQRARIQFQLR